MEFKRLTKIKPLMGLLIVLSLICLLFTLTACNNKNIDAKEIKIVEDTIPEVAIAGQVELSSIKVNIINQNDEVQEIALTESMLDTASKALLKETGEKTLNVFYKDCATTFTIFLFEEGTETVNVTFYSKDGTKLAKKYAVKGGSIEAPNPPEEEGLIFDCWRDKTTSEEVSFSSVSEDLVVFPSYVENANKYTIKFVDYKNNVVKTLTNVSYGSTIDEPQWEKPAEILDFNWTWDFENDKVTGNRTINMVYEKKKTPIKFMYIYSPESLKNEMDTTTTVNYGEQPSETVLNSAIEELKQKGKTFIKWLNLDAIKAGTSSTLYAVVEATQYTVSFADDSNNTAIITSGQSYEFPKDNGVFKVGYYFANKWIDINTNTIYDAGKSYIIESDLTLKGYYEPESKQGEFTFTFSPLTENDGITTLSYDLKRTIKYDDVINIDYVDEFLEELKQQHENISDFVVNVITDITDTNNKSTIESSGYKVDESTNHKFEVSCISEDLGSPGLSYVKVGTGEDAYLTVNSYTPTISDIELNIIIPNTYYKGDNEYPVKEIDDYVFAGHNYTMKLKLGDNVKVIGNNAFNGVTFSNDIDLNNVVALGNQAFESASAVSYLNDDNQTVYKNIKVIGGAEITTIPQMAFYNTKGISEVVLADTVTTIENSAFENSEDLIKINLEKITTLNNKAFKGAQKLVNIGNLDSLKTIGTEVFNNTAIQNVDLKVIENINEDSLVGMTELESLSIASNSENEVAFNLSNILGNIKLTSIVLGNNVSELTNSASLNDLIVSSIDFGDLVYIDPTVFNMLPRIDTIIVDDSVEHGDIVKTSYEVRNNVLIKKIIDTTDENNNEVILQYYPVATFGDYVIPDDVTSINNAGITNAHFNRLTINNMIEKTAGGIENLNIVSLPYEIAKVWTAEGENYNFNTIDAMFNTNCQYYINDFNTCCGLESDEDYETNVANRDSWKAELDLIDNTKLVVDNSGLRYFYDVDNKLLYSVIDEKVYIVSGDETAKTIIIPATIDDKDVVGIMDNAFANYIYLETLDIKAKLNHWNMSGAFDNCSSLANITVTEIKDKTTINYNLLNSTKIYNDNIVIVLDGVPVAYNKNYEVEGKTVVDITADDLKGATYIPSGLFNNNIVLQTIELPDTVIKIEDNAFENARALTTINLNQVGNLGKYAFKDCTSLESVIIPKAINGNDVDDGKLPVGVFAYCSSLKSISMPNVNGFFQDYEGNSYAFKGCTSLKDIDFINHFTGPIYNGTFANCVSITSIDFTTSSINQILDDAFLGCSSIAHIEFSAKITELGENVFAGCDNLLTIRIRGTAGIFAETAPVIAVGVFSENAKIYVDSKAKDRADVVLANYIDNIIVDEPRISFEMKEGYEAGLNNLGKPNINKAYFVEEPSYPEFEGYLFVGWYIGDTRIEFPYTTTINTTFEAKYYDLTKGSLVSEDLSKISENNYEISSYSSLDETCYIPSVFVDSDGEKNIVAIDLTAFYESNVKELIIPEGVKELYGVLTGSKVTKIKIPSTVTTIENMAFFNMENLEIEWAENSQLVDATLAVFDDTKWYVEEKAKAILGNNNGFVVAGRMAIDFIGINSGMDKVAIIPSDVIKLNDELFKDNTILTSVTFNDALQYIGDDCFTGAINIENIIYETEAGNSQLVDFDVDDIGIADTKWYDNQNRVVLGTILAQYKNIYTDLVSIPAYITKISSYALQEGTATQVVFEGDKVVEIGDYAFSQSKLTSFVLPSSVVKLGTGVFANCIDLLEFDGSNGNALLTVLPDELFNGCESLHTVILGDNFKALGNNNFGGCDKLENITANGINIDTDIQLSGIMDTPWANPEITDDDQNIILGTVYLKYIQGNLPLCIIDGLRYVLIPDGVTIIYMKAFFDNNQIGIVYLPNSVIEIKNEAFKNCTLLQYIVTEESSLINIDVSAFENTAISRITLPETLVNIGDKAFKDLKLEFIIIPDSVEKIGMEAFSSIDELESIEIGKGISYIGSNAFADNPSLIKVIWAMDAMNVKIDDDEQITIKQLYNIDKNLAEDSSYTNDKKAYINGLFSRTGGIAIRVYIPSEAYNIIDISTLEHLTNWNDYEINSFSLFIEGDLPQVSFDSNGYIMEPFNAEVISSSSVLGVPTKADHTFMGWYEDEAYNIPISYPFNVSTDITIYAKWYNNNWDNDHMSEDVLTYSLSNNNYIITGWGESDEATLSMYIPNKVNGLKVNGINISAGDQAKADVVEEIIFTQASNFTDINTNIFKVFTNLEKVYLHDSNMSKVPYMVEDGAMYSIDKKVLIAYFRQYTENAQGERELITKFTVPYGVERILPYAFVNSGLTSINIPASVTFIGENAFNDNMSDIVFAEDISLIDVDKDSFNNTNWYNNLAYDYYKVDYSNVGTFYSAANVLLEYYEVAAPSVLKLPNTMKEFDITVIASNMYTRIDDNYEREPYDNVILPSKLERINSEAFAMKDAPIDGEVHWLDTVNVDGENCSETLTYIANDVFSVTKYYNSTLSSDLLILGKILLKYKNASTTLDLETEEIETIAKGAFKGSRLKEIYLPNSLKVIGDEAFSGSSDLEEIVIPSKVTSIGNQAFLNCQSLDSVIFEGEKLEEMGSQIFSGCYHINELFVPYSVKEIGDGAFEGCTDLENVYFDKPIYEDSGTELVITGWSNKSELTSLGKQAFEECSSLTEIAIPNGLTKISEKTFAGCTDLVYVNFETDKSKVKTIEYQAFMNCESLGSIIDVDDPSLITLELPNALITVEDEAFFGCEKLYGVLFNYNIASIGNNVFGACRYLTKLEISSSNAPVITENTFLRKYDLVDPYYALRIYVGDDDLTYNDYENDWASSNTGDNSFILCRKSDDKPSLTYKYEKQTSTVPDVDSFVVPVNKRNDVYINPVYTFFGATVVDWEFYSIDGTSDDSRIGKALGGDGMDYTLQFNPITAEYDVILVMDYDIVIINAE